MGCDIHPHIEVRKDCRWVRHDWRKRHETGEFYDEARTDPKTNYDTLFKDPLYIGRNYSLFSILANVRNGTGFAGCDTGDGFKPISMPRGLPSDVSSEVFEEDVTRLRSEDDENGELTYEQQEKWVRRGISRRIDERTVSDPDHHSHSWLTVAEMLAYDWDQKTKRRGWVDPWNFKLTQTKGKPDSWSGGISGSSIEHVSNVWMRKAIDSGEIQWEGDIPAENAWDGRAYSTSLQRSMKDWDLKKGTVGGNMRDETRPRHYTNVEWEVSYRNCVDEFLTKTLPALQQLGAPEDVRLVFWFDN